MMWFMRKPAAVAAKPSLQVSSAAKAEETNMSGASVPNPNPTTVVAIVAKPNGFIRFIDALEDDFRKVEPVVMDVAVAAEPLLALSPIGPEYVLVVNAIKLATSVGAASLAAGVNLTGAQKMSLVLQASTPGVTTILASKGITEPAAVTTAIAQFAQNVYGLQTGPAYIPTK